ncbi:hypothetical protein ISP15_18015 [Dyella jejuensis]|uniref:Uncharacterized protein n=1 Tax=Dyella jejuensis TaxID=1432009 RepID=A0ABW8JN01_9GAMM
MSALTWFENFSSEEGNGSIISSFAALGLNSVALCEDIADKKTPDQLRIDGYKVLRNAVAFLDEVAASKTFMGKVLGRILDVAGVTGDVADIVAKFENLSGIDGI